MKKRKTKKETAVRPKWANAFYGSLLVAVLCAVTVAFAFHRLKERVQLRNNELSTANELHFLKQLEALEQNDEQRKVMFVNVERPEPVKKEVEIAKEEATTTTAKPVTDAPGPALGEMTTNAFMKTFKREQCADVTLMEPGQKRIAISSFPGSGNTWARHLIHMATGHWTGNARSSQKLKDAGWQGEDENCMEGTTIAIKTHKWHTYKKCAYDGAIIIIRNPFHALIAEFNRQMTSNKVGSIDVDLYKSMGWEKFLVEYSRDYFDFFNEWFSRFHNPIEVVCFEEMVEDPVEQVGNMLKFLRFPPYRLDCITENVEGDFHREHHVHSHHVKIYSEEQTERLKTIIAKISLMLTRHQKRDCTQFFNYTNVQYY